VQNNSIFLELVAKQLNISGFNRYLKKKKILIATFHLKNESDSEKD
jgi:hypothetical protein